MCIGRHKISFLGRFCTPSQSVEEWPRWPPRLFVGSPAATRMTHASWCTLLSPRIITTTTCSLGVHHQTRKRLTNSRRWVCTYDRQPAYACILFSSGASRANNNEKSTRQTPRATYQLWDVLVWLFVRRRHYLVLLRPTARRYA